MKAPLTKMLDKLDAIIDNLNSCARKIKDIISTERDNIREEAREELLHEDNHAT